MELPFVFSPTLTLPLQTQRRVCVPALAGLALAQCWLCVPRAPGAADGLGRVAAQCWHCLWLPCLPWGDRQGVLAMPPLAAALGPQCPREPGTAWGHRAAVPTPALLPVCPRWSPCRDLSPGCPPPRAGGRIHLKGTGSCSDGVAPSSSFAICTAAMWVRERSVGYPRSSRALVLLPRGRGMEPLGECAARRL